MYSIVSSVYRGRVESFYYSHAKRIKKNSAVVNVHSWKPSLQHERYPKADTQDTEKWGHGVSNFCKSSSVGAATVLRETRFSFAHVTHPWWVRHVNKKTISSNPSGSK
jgi:hypothetical protein